MPNISKIKINNILYDIKDANGFSGSWNDLSDKPFYEDEEYTDTVIYQNDAVGFRNSMGIYSSSLVQDIISPFGSFIAGEKYSIVIDDVSLNNQDAIEETWGISVSDTENIPPSIAASTSLNNDGTYSLSFDVSSTVISGTGVITVPVSIIHHTKNIKTLDDKYISDNIARVSDVANLKDDLLNGAGEAYDTLKELGDLINENVDAIDALETIAVNKADKSDVNALQDLVGDTAVSEQISTAIENSGAVLYTEQTLTDEQKAQARANIGTVGYEWHEFENGNYFVANIPNKTGINNFESSITTENSNTSALTSLIGSIKIVTTYAESTNTISLYDGILSAIIALNESGDITLPCSFMYTRSIDDVVDYESYFCNYVSRTGRLILQKNDLDDARIIYQNGAITVNTIFPDTTLTESARPADAKATGDAINAVSALVGDTSVSEQINTAISESVADWNQADETAADYIKNKPEIATDDEIIELLMQEDMFPVVQDSDGSLLADENDNILLW